MKITKRDGSEMLFDANKIKIAVTKANKSTDDENARLSEQEIDDITSKVTAKCEGLGRAANVEEIQDMVEEEIMRKQKFTILKNYMLYRYERALARQANSTDKQILTLIDCNNEEVKQENSNKNPIVNSVQRDYME